MIANIIGRGIGYGPARYIVTHGFGTGVAPPVVGGGSICATAQYVTELDATTAQYITTLDATTAQYVTELDATMTVPECAL